MWRCLDSNGGAGKPRRSRYGSENSAIAGSLQTARGVIRECKTALASMEFARIEVCQCGHRQPTRGGTAEDALELSDDDDVEILAVTYRPIALEAKHPPPADPEVIGGAFLTAEDISGHQKNQKLGVFAKIDVEEPQKVPIVEVPMVEVPMVEVPIVEVPKKEVPKEEVQTDNGAVVALTSAKAQMKDAKSALKQLDAKKPPLSVKVPAKGGFPGENATPGKRGRDKERAGDDGEGGDDLEEPMFGSPRHKKTREVKYAESDEDESDYEVRSVHSDSDSDKEPSPEIEDPFADIWRDYAIMQRQTKREDDDGVVVEGCEHTFEYKKDVGRACSKCGLIREDIKDMCFHYRAPKTIRQHSQAKAGRVDMWDEGGEIEEEAKLVGMPPLEAHSSLEDAMHPHQLEGFKFLSKNLVEEDSGGCMLAFAPGTGKSFLMISFIHSFMLQVPNARPMIVAPKSMLRPWTQEFKKWQVEETTVLNLYEAGDDAAKLEMLKLWQETRSVLLVGYAQCTNMCGEIGRYLIEGPGLVVLDEGHCARTEDTKILKSLSRVHTKRRVLLSGTPFNNNFQEFYNTLELVRPDFMRKASAYMEATLNTLVPSQPKAPETASPLLKRSSNAGRQAFKDAIGENLFENGKHASIPKALGQLRKLIQPFVAWHKGKILETLPGITDLTIMLELSPTQLELLKNNKSEVRDNLQKRAAAIYVHPILEPVSEDGKRSEKDPRLRGDSIDVKLGAKLKWVMDLVELCDAAKEKVLIFSEYLYSLALIENVAMHKMKWNKGSQILRIDGKMGTAEREAAINKFNNDPEAKMVCASIKACGEGISLVGASRVVILEVVWNPSVTRQAISRAFRIGQQKKVFVYRLIAADTYEEHRMHATATRKEWLSKLLFDPSISCIDPNSILWDVTDPKDCNDSFLQCGPLRNGVKSIYEREF
ncbi:hypothetical protein KC19_6G046100 [Ceratodon purpureus]|uniref:Uncharacterized protein n=1 Tax=Ceratodon purpureus TaxID=3225 RepID=A0A8T0HDQ2_CERPU|nr:hypothetical protein KC19_6G046100 [Ceratodon purpureus]